MAKAKGQPKKESGPITHSPGPSKAPNYAGMVRSDKLQREIAVFARKGESKQAALDRVKAAHSSDASKSSKTDGATAAEVTPKASEKAEVKGEGKKKGSKTGADKATSPDDTGTKDSKREESEETA
jgi:hypothetical protein